MTSTREAPDAPPALSRRRINVVFATIGLGMLMAALDQTIVSTALPTIVAELGGAGHMAWVVTAYMLTEAVAAVLAGKFGDIFGRKLLFQLSAVIFVVGSVVAGISQDMLLLIVGRAVQGVGGGGLMVTAMALIADVIPLRERGKYQGALGAVFGVTTVLGPMLGGVFTDHATWRWCFYVNIPIAVLMIALAATTIPVVRPAVRPVIDYLGIALVALGVTGLILGLEWGGSEYAWTSPMIIGLFAGSAILLFAFVQVELRAAEPMLPMSLFRDSVFTVCSILSFIVGFAMLGALTFLPTYLQYVSGVSATESGFRTLPMVLGLLISSIFSGNVVATTGRYRFFPVAGSAVMALGLYLMSTMGAGTGVWLESLYMLVLGLGIGLSMQVLTIVVQNTVPYAQLGTATSGVTFFRTVGSAFGTAVFGTLYSTRLETELAVALAESGVPATAVQSPAAVRALPAEQAAPIIDAYATSITSVFLWVVPVAVFGFVVAWFLKEVPLRDSSRAGAPDMGEGFAVPDSPDRVAQLERAIAEVLRRANETRVVPGPSLRELAGGTVPEELAWAVGETHLRVRLRRDASMAAIAHAHGVPLPVVEPVYRRAMDAGLIVLDGDRSALTESGRELVDRFKEVWRGWLDEQLEDWTFEDPADRALLEHALYSIAGKLLDERDNHPAVPA